MSHARASITGYAVTPTPHPVQVSTTLVRYAIWFKPSSVLVGGKVLNQTHGCLPCRKSLFLMKHAKDRTIMEYTDTQSTAFDALVAPASLIAPTRHTASHRVLNFNCEHTHTHTEPFHLFAKSNECFRKAPLVQTVKKLYLPVNLLDCTKLNYSLEYRFLLVLHHRFG